MIALAIVAGYLLGTFPSAELITRIATRGKVDIREFGSGNPGTLNAIHAIGNVWGMVVLFFDVAKGVAAGFLGWALAGPEGAYAAATASIAGHIFPVWSGFRGGKGVATSAGACLAVFPAYFPINLAVALLERGALGPGDARHPDRVRDLDRGRRPLVGVRLAQPLGTRAWARPPGVRGGRIGADSLGVRIGPQKSGSKSRRGVIRAAGEVRIPAVRKTLAS